MPDEALTCAGCGALTCDGDYCPECRVEYAEIAWDEFLDDALMRVGCHE